MIKNIIIGTISAAGGALAYRKTRIGGSYWKVWTKEFWAGASKTEKKAGKDKSDKKGDDKK